MELALFLVVGLTSVGLASTLLKILSLSKDNKKLAKQVLKISEINRGLTRQYGDISQELFELRSTKEDHSFENFILRNKLRQAKTHLENFQQFQKKNQTIEGREASGSGSGAGHVEVQIDPPIIESPYELSVIPDLGDFFSWLIWATILLLFWIIARKSVHEPM